MFANRLDAAHHLAQALTFLKGRRNVIILAIPRGGLPIGAYIAHYLSAPLDVVLTKKIGAPGNPEFAIGAATINSVFIDPTYATQELRPYIAQEVTQVQALLKKRDVLFHTHHASIALRGKTVVIVDDGVATGHTVLAALRAVHAQQPHQIIIATPVLTPQAAELFQAQNAQVVSVLMPQHLHAVGQFYQDFQQVSDAQALQIMHEFAQPKE